MNTLFDILTALKTDLENDLPDLLYDASLDNFEVYNVGGSRDPEQVGLFIYPDEKNVDYEIEKLSIIFQLQLYKIETLAAMQYQNIVETYLKNYDVDRIGADMLNNINSDIYPVENNQSNYVFITVEWQQSKDSCDN